MNKKSIEIIENDLLYIIDSCDSEFKKMSGSNLLITGVRNLSISKL